MSKWLTEQLQRRWLINITILLFVCFSVDAIATAFVSVMIDATWSDLTGTQKWIRVALIFKAWATATAAFLTNSAKRIANDELPFPSGDTTIITKTAVQQTETTVPKV